MFCSQNSHGIFVQTYLSLYLMKYIIGYEYLRSTSFLLERFLFEDGIREKQMIYLPHFWGTSQSCLLIS